MIIHCHEIGHRMLIRIIFLLRIERCDIIEAKLLLYVVFNNLIALLEIVHLKWVASVLNDVVRIEDILLLLVYVFAHAILLVHHLRIAGLLYFPIRWLILSVEILCTISIIEIGRLIHLVGINLIDNERTQDTLSFRLLHILSIFHEQKRLLGNRLHRLRSHTYAIK